MQDVLDAVSNPRRRAILRLVWTRELSAGEIASRFDVSWPAVSQNLRVLKEAGLVKDEAGPALASPENAAVIGLDWTMCNASS